QEGIKKAFEMLDRMEKNSMRKSQDEWKHKATTHALPEDRLAAIDHKLLYAKNEGKYFQVDEKLLPRFRKEAQREVLNDLISSFQYFKCIERAFRYHLFDPDNPDYIYYLVEATRRYCYLDPELWGKNFITNQYQNALIVNDSR